MTEDGTLTHAVMDKCGVDWKCSCRQIQKALETTRILYSLRLWSKGQSDGGGIFYVRHPCHRRHLYKVLLMRTRG